MFDFSFGELVVVGAVALVVIGPERLPKVARTVGAMVARAKRYAAGVKADIQREIELDNLRQIEAEMHEAGRKLHGELTAGLDPLHDTAQEAQTALQGALSDPPAEPDPVALTPDDKQFDLFAAPAPVSKPPERDRR